jgi:diguanylate cyclase (GGDEF)-like protein/PAS domain S-box-containing protein
MTGKPSSSQRSIERAEALARRAEDRLRMALDALPEGIVFLDAEGRYILWNQTYAEIYSGSSDLFEVGARLEDTLRIGVARGNYPEAIGREEAWLQARLALLANPGVRHEQQLADGRWIMIEERRTPDGGSIGLRVDITELKSALERADAAVAQLGETRNFLDMVVEGMPAILFVNDPATGAFVMLNRAGETALGCSRDELVGKSYAEKFAPAEAEALAAQDLALIAGQATTASQEISFETEDGAARLLAVRKILIRDGDGAPQYIVSVCDDITEQRANEARIAHLAGHDALTGLPNRVLFHDRLSRGLRRVTASDHVAVLCLDLDRFKIVNDTLGHPIGDALLKMVAQRLASCIREGDTVARLGGDEFAIIQHHVQRPDAPALLAARIVEVMASVFDVEGHQLVVGASVGIALAPADGSSAEALLKSADMAMYRAKNEGRGAFRYFEAEMDVKLQARRRLELDMRRALVAGEFILHYQPLLNMADNLINGCEALVRWNHPVHGMIMPDDFIPLAEEIGLIVPLGEWIIRQACADGAKLPGELKMAVNLSPAQFRSERLVPTVIHALAATGLAPDRLELEITESVLLQDSAANMKVLHELRSLGVRICMDDFGTGYSSLSYLRSFPFDKIKIDRSFVSDLSDDPDAGAIVKAVAGLGQSLGMVTTAEGVETVEQLARLRQEGCTEVQGYLISRPIACDALLEFIHATQGVPAPATAEVVSAPPSEGGRRRAGRGA